MVVDDVVLVFANYIHRRQDVQRVIHTPLHVLEVDLLSDLPETETNKVSLTRKSHTTYIAELFVHLEDLVGDLGASDHGPLPNFLKDGARQKDELLILLFLVVAFG